MNATCEKEGLGVFTFGMFLYSGFIVRFASEGMGYADFNELLSFSKAARYVNRLFLGFIVGAPFALILYLIGIFIHDFFLILFLYLIVPLKLWVVMISP